MSLKDVIFVGLILVTGLFFYWHGLDTGVRRTRRLFERYLRNPEVFTELPDADTPPKVEPENNSPQLTSIRQSLPKSPMIRGLFGKN